MKERLYPDSDLSMILKLMAFWKEKSSCFKKQKSTNSSEEKWFSQMIALGTDCSIDAHRPTFQLWAVALLIQTVPPASPSTMPALEMRSGAKLRQALSSFLPFQSSSMKPVTFS